MHSPLSGWFAAGRTAVGRTAVGRTAVGRIAVASTVLVVGSAVAAAPAAEAATIATAGAAYTPLSSPVRVVKDVSVGSRHTHTIALSDVPSRATAVLLTVSATGGSAAGYLTVFGTGTSRPSTPSVDFAAGQTIANSTVVRVTGGKPSAVVYNGSARTARVTVDVTGYWAPAAAGQGSFGAITPTRRLNTSTGVGAKGPLRSHRTLSFTATGGSTGIPSTASAVLLDITAAKPTKAGSLTAWAASGSRPAVTTMDFAAHATLAHLAVVPVSSAGRVSVYNGSTGTVAVSGDVLGWFAAGDPTAAGALGVLNPYRVLSAKTIGAHKTVSFSSSGKGGVPKAGVSALALNLRVASAAARGHLAVDPGSSLSTSNLEFAKGQSVADLVLARASSGSVRVYNGSSASIRVSADVTGYVLGTAIAVPRSTRSHYLRVNDADQVSAAGTQDAGSGSDFTVLDLGAQSNDGTGVVLSATNTKITYARVRALVNDYVDAFTTRAPAAPLTVAVATNNDGDFSTLSYAARASKWAALIHDVRQDVATKTHVTVAAANDIEPSGSSTETQARYWETSFIARLEQLSPHDSTPTDLYFIGSADGCPTRYGQINKTCSYGWTEEQLYTLAGGDGSRSGQIQALPQIYTAGQAVQWANIAASGGGVATFDGSLTEHSACPKATAAGCTFASFSASLGFAALFHGLSTVGVPRLKHATDLDIVG